MSIKRVLAAVLAFLFLFGICACGDAEQSLPESSEANTPAQYIEPAVEKLVIYTVFKDIEQFAERYTSQTGVQTQVILITPEEYLSGAIDLSDADVIAADQNMLPVLYENGEDLTHYGTTGKTEALFELAAGTDGQGALRAIGLWLPVGVIVYRRDIAQNIFGTDDTQQTAMLFCDFLTIAETAKKVRDKGYYIFSGSEDIEKYANAGEVWTCGGKLNLSKARLDYLNSVAEMYQEALLLSDTEPETEQVFAYSLPAWAIPDIAKIANGSLGLCSGPCGYIQGTWLGISSSSQNKQEAWGFIEFAALSEQTAQWWMDTTGRALCLKSVLEARRDYQHPDFGGQKIYEFLMDEASKDFPAPSVYDKAISDEFAKAVSAFKQGLLTRTEAIDTFRSAVKEAFPQLEVE